MKTYKHLYPQVVSLENLQRAYTQASKGKRRYPYVDRFAFGLERELFQLQRELQEKAYQPGPYHNFYITEPKRRLVDPGGRSPSGNFRRLAQLSRRSMIVKRDPNPLRDA